ncbi:MAG: hypothetical protein H7A25_26415 [Leptospiraceae bacterium]|nr:hypothetical protein [Leptospiraceae bacterium]
MNKIGLILLLVSMFPVYAEKLIDIEKPEDNKRSNMPPLMERYVLDELKALRIDIMEFKAGIVEKVANKELSLADKAVSYSINTVTYFFYMVVGAISLMALVGWQSFRDLKENLRKIADAEITRLTEKYEKRLDTLEKEIREKGELILENQKAIEKTQNIHSLWVLSTSETDPQRKIEIYDQILELEPEDLDVLSKKAEAALEIGQDEWVLNIINRILELNPDYLSAHILRARVYLNTEQKELSLKELEKICENYEQGFDRIRMDETLSELIPELIKRIKP